MRRLFLLLILALITGGAMQAQLLSFHLDPAVTYVQRWTPRGDSLHYSLDPGTYPWQPEAQVGWLFTDSVQLNQFYRRPDGRPLSVDFSRHFVLGWLDPAGEGRQLQLRAIRAEVDKATITLQGFLQPARDSSRLQPALYLVEQSPELQQLGPANCRFELKQGAQRLFSAQDWHFPLAFALEDLRDLLRYYEAALAPEPAPAAPVAAAVEAPGLPAPAHLEARGYQLRQRLPLHGSNFLKITSFEHWNRYFQAEADAYPKLDPSWFERYYAVAFVKQGPLRWQIGLDQVQRSAQGLRLFYRVHAQAPAEPGPQQAWHLLLIEKGAHGPLSFRENGQVYATQED